MKNKYIRHQPSFSTQSDIYGDEYWAAQVERNLEKNSVVSKNHSSLFDQITSIMDGATSKFSTVEAKVEDMKERAGLNAYLKQMNKQSKNEVNKNIIAEIQVSAATIYQNENVPLSMKKHPNIISTLENIIRDTKGNLSIPAIIEKLKSIHKHDLPELKDWEDPKLMHLVSRLNLAEKTNHFHGDNHQSNLGKQDLEIEFDRSNEDAFHGLMPVKSANFPKYLTKKVQEEVAELESENPYFDSAKGVMLTPEQTKNLILKKHNMSYEDYQLIMEDLGQRKEYDAQEVLKLLGY